MSVRLSNALRALSSSLDLMSAQAKFGLVSSVNGETGFARVVIQPDGVLSGWLPVVSPWIGSGWGLVCPLSPGDQVLVLPQEGDAEQGVILGGIYSNEQRPPSAPNGEFWLVHKSGSYLKLRNDGSIQIKGDLHVEGDVYDSLGSLSHLRTTYNQHTHRSGSSTTSTPTPQDQGNE
jgi:phage baseplate assembly protein V